MQPAHSAAAKSASSALRFEILAEGLAFPEAPVSADNGDLIVAEIAQGTLVRISPDGRSRVIARPGGGPNGLAWGPGGLLYCCNNGGSQWHSRNGGLFPGLQAEDYSGGRIEVIDPETGAVETLYKDGDFGCRLVAPNDLVFDRHGGFWFTDHGHTRARDRDVTGVFYAAADGSSLCEVVFPMDKPNGIGLSPDHKALYVAETYTCRLYEFGITGPGVVASTENPAGPGRPLYRPAGFKFFDSLGIEEDGNICIATCGEPGISVISPAGDLVDFVQTGDLLTTNICWDRGDRSTAYVTLSSSGRVARTVWPRDGLRLAPV